MKHTQATIIKASEQKLQTLTQKQKEIKRKLTLKIRTCQECTRGLFVLSWSTRTGTETQDPY